MENLDSKQTNDEQKRFMGKKLVNLSKLNRYTELT